MRKLIVLSLMVLFVAGCGKVANESSGNGSGGGSSTPTTPPVVTLPVRILEPYTDTGALITFTSPTGHTYISELGYGTAMQEKIVVVVTASCPYSNLRFFVVGANKAIAITGAGTYTAYMQNGTDDSRNIYLNRYTLPMDKVSGNFVEIQGDGVTIKRYNMDGFY